MENKKTLYWNHCATSTTSMDASTAPQFNPAAPLAATESQASTVTETATSELRYVPQSVRCVESFVFHPGYLHPLTDMDVSDALRCLLSLVHYGCYGVEPTDEFTAAYVNLFRPAIDAAKSRYRAKVALGQVARSRASIRKLEGNSSPQTASSVWTSGAHISTTD